MGKDNIRSIEEIKMMENYDRWAQAYWKKQIEGNLTEQEQKELEKLEKENMKTLENQNLLRNI